MCNKKKRQKVIVMSQYTVYVLALIFGMDHLCLTNP